MLIRPQVYMQTLEEIEEERGNSAEAHSQLIHQKSAGLPQSMELIHYHGINHICKLSMTIHCILFCATNADNGCNPFTQVMIPTKQLYIQIKLTLFAGQKGSNSFNKTLTPSPTQHWVIDPVNCYCSCVNDKQFPASCENQSNVPSWLRSLRQQRLMVSMRTPSAPCCSGDETVTNSSIRCSLEMSDVISDSLLLLDRIVISENHLNTPAELLSCRMLWRQSFKKFNLARLICSCVRGRG